MPPTENSDSSVIDPLSRNLLVAISQYLVDQGKHPELVRLCALWSSQEALPVAIALDEARALLDLRLMDLAWVRLRELDKTQRHRVEVQALTAEMFVERGWPGRARRILERAVADYPERRDLQMLLERSKSSPLRPPSQARKIEREGTPKEQLDLAERYLCAGSQLKARSILKRLRRGRTEFRSRVDALLWGLETELEDEPLSLMGLAKELASELPLLEDGPLDQTLEGLSSAEVTTRGPVPVELQELPEGGFPSLFRWVDDSGDFKDSESEVTRISSLSELRSSAEATHSFELHSPDETGEDFENDTKVMRVIHHDAKGTPTLIEELQDPLSTESQPKDRVRGLESDVHTSSFNLADMDFETDDEFLEEEDAGLIVMTRREIQERAPNSEEPYTAAPLAEDWDDSVGRTPGLSSGFESTDPTVPVAQAPLSRDRRRKVAASAPPRVRKRRPRKKSSQARFFVGVALCMAAVLIALGFWRHLATKKQEEVLLASLKVLGDGEYQALLQEEARLLHLIEQGVVEPTGAHMASLGLVQLTLWGDFSGGRDRWERAVQSIRDAGLYGVSQKARTLANAFRSYYQGDLENSATSLEILGDSLAIAAYMRARISLEKANYKEAREFVDLALQESPDHVVSLLTKADICLYELDEECALKAIQTLQDQGVKSGRLKLLRIRLDALDETAVDQAHIIEGALAAGLDLAPRQVGQLRVQLAQLYSIDGNIVAAERALEAALAADSESAEARFWLGSLRLREGRVKLALSDFRACVRSRPAQLDCHRGMVHSLLELDRVEEARLHVLGHEPVLGALREKALFSAWLSYAAEEDASSIVSHLKERGPRENYLVGLALGRDGQSAMAESTLIEAGEQLKNSLNALDQWMAPRSFAAAARYGESEYRGDQVKRAWELGQADPMVMVDLGWYNDSVGEKEEAARLFDLVDGLGRESAIAHFNRGWFFLDYGDKQARSKSAWIRYRDLNPSGTRAERVMRQLLDLY